MTAPVSSPSDAAGEAQGAPPESAPPESAPSGSAPSGPSTKPSKGAKPANIHAYDFNRPYRISTDRLRTLEAIFERLCKSLEAWLIGRVRKQVEFRLLSVEQKSFGEFTQTLPVPCAAFGFEITNAGGQKGVINSGDLFSFFVVDRLFGGAGKSSNLSRMLTVIERMTVKLVVERIGTLLSEIWMDYVPLEIEITSFESVPEMVQAGSRQDPVLVANIEFYADGESALIPICLPFGVLDSFFSSIEQQRVKPMTGSEDERRVTRERAEGTLRSTNVDVSARLPRFTLPFRTILGLPVGGVLATPISADTPMELWIGDEPRYRGVPGRSGTKLALRITEDVDAPSR
ncbi:hypothetical protein EBR44_00235 [bacterium]|nr:hypothetical protein [bacterium]